MRKSPERVPQAAPSPDVGAVPATALSKAVERRVGALAAVLVGLAVLAVYSEAILTSRVFYERDIHGYWYPYRAVVEQAIAARSLPLWNPYVGFGAPLLSDPNFQLAYPPTWLALLLPAALHFKVFTIGHTLLAAAGAWALARRLGLGPAAAAVAGTGYALSGPFLSSISLLHHPLGAAWIPWVVWALEGLLRRPGSRSALILGFAAAAQVLTGSGEMCLASALIGGPLAAWRLLRPGPGGRAKVSILARFTALAALLAAALSAVQWLPAAEAIDRSGRARMDLHTSSYWSLHPASLADLAVPRLVSDLPLSEASRASVFEGRGPLLVCIYLGAVPLALGLLALALRGASAAAGGPALGALALVLLSLGRHTPLYGWFFALPGFHLLRYPQKLLIPAAFCVAFLAALGMEAWRRPWAPVERRRARRAALVLVTGALALVALAAWLMSDPSWLAARLATSGPELGATFPGMSRKLLRTALLLGVVALLAERRAQSERGGRVGLLVLLLLAVGDAVLVGRGINPLAPAALLAHRPAVVGLVDRAERLYATSEPGCGTAGRGPAGWKRAWISALGIQDTLRPPTGARWGLFGSYDGEFTGLGSVYSGLLNWEVRSRWGGPDALRLLRLGNVGEVLDVGRTVPPGLVRVGTLASPFVCPLLVLRVPDPVARAYVVHAERSAAGPGSTLEALLARDFEPARDVVLDAATTGSVGNPPYAGDEVAIVGRTLSTLRLRARLSSPGTLVVVEAYDPNWRATVDGRRVPVLRGNGLFRAVRLPAGSHEVRFAYRPWSATLGALLSACGLLAALALAWGSRSTRRPARSAER